MDGEKNENEKKKRSTADGNKPRMEKWGKTNEKKVNVEILGTFKHCERNGWLEDKHEIEKEKSDERTRTDNDRE